jgi:hypothetical protein
VVEEEEDPAKMKGKQQSSTEMRAANKKTITASVAIIATVLLPAS